jgi:transcription termination/antitermination protein NusG
MNKEFEFSVGSIVRITSGPFQRFTGTITEIDQQSRLVKVEIDIFGRPEPMEFRFSDIVREG